ncbi:hypothetical protein GCM10028806_34380 [Spirosoma terrae]|uniref:Uncharacterized protein n=1 Tax=Spirosoma terrae TaxID=1968276 RepID=A0A6L9L8Q6_9BACT|nr:hypothetical protein [Spirosoma terrae]NDU95752.1 hypothetical protein [Spirosoma terrae]
MLSYLQKPRYVDAYQYQGEDTLPEFLQWGHIDRKTGNVFRIAYRHEYVPFYAELGPVVKTPAGLTALRLGDFVILDPDGFYLVKTADEFHDQYVPAPTGTLPEAGIQETGHTASTYIPIPVETERPAIDTVLDLFKQGTPAPEPVSTLVPPADPAAVSLPDSQPQTELPADTKPDDFLVPVTVAPKPSTKSASKSAKKTNASAAPATPADSQTTAAEGQQLSPQAGPPVDPTVQSAVGDDDLFG